MKQKLIGPILIFLFLALLSISVILYGRGYRVDLKQKGLKTTGLLAATSDPKGASIFVDDKLVSATDDTLNLEPGWYDVRLDKEGYIPWQKKMEIKKEIVAETKASLFRSNPSLSPLTSSGTKAPSLSPDGTKIAYVVPYQPTTNNRQPTTNYGIFVSNLNNHPLSLSRKPTLIFSRKISPQEEISLLWSPNSAQVLLLEKSTAFLLDLSKKNQSPPNLIGTLPSLFSTWQRKKEELEKKKVLSLAEPLIELFSRSAKILAFSPNETKILYRATASASISKVIKPPLLATNPTQETRAIELEKIYVYDLKEDRNYLIDHKVGPSKKSSTESRAVQSREAGQGPTFTGSDPLQWLPTSRHLILTEENTISILEYDGTNKTTIYASSFEENFAVPFPDGNRLVILTTLNPTTSTLSNLYSLSLK